MRLIRSAALSIVLIGAQAYAQSAAYEVQTKESKSFLVNDFATALLRYAEVPGAVQKEPANEIQQMWERAFKERGISPKKIRSRIESAQKDKNLSGLELFAPYQKLQVETVRISKTTADTPISKDPISLHIHRLDVIDEYDDIYNDDIYMYTITTYGDLTWGKVTSVYKNLDEGDSVFLNAEDRGVLGPKGERVPAADHLIIDFGLIESDGDDVALMKKISDAVVDLAAVALAVANPQVGAVAAQVRAETRNLMRALVELNRDDRLVIDSLVLSNADLTDFAAGTMREFYRRYSHSTFWTHFDYKLRYRIFK